ncbi:MAG: aldehyde ferredoxin oxidoreductase C-terminal domain-containing protein [Holophaga sp.]|jgi:aldehyde:ferredoxin oxidoreductase
MDEEKFGYTGRWAFVDLTRGTVTIRPSDPEVERDYLGGRGVGAFLVAEQVKRCGGPVQPLGPENRIVIGGAPLHDTKVHTAGRGSASFLSPMTCSREPLEAGLPPVHGLMTHTSVGGAFATRLKRAGFDQIIIDGRSPRPVRLVIRGTDLRIVDAEEECFEARDGVTTVARASRMEALLKKLGGAESDSVYLGPAGWSQVPWACLTTDGDRNFGRGGLGAVFASKNLLAITVSGESPWGWRNPALFTARLGELEKKIQEIVGDPGSTAHFRPIVGTTYWLDRAQQGGYLGKAGGYLPWHNYDEGNVPPEAYAKVSTGAFLEVSAQHKVCAGCREIFCSRLVRTRAGGLLPRPEFETAALFIDCGITDREDVVQLNHLCNELGVDTMTMAAMVSAAMDLDERGILRKLGMALPFGDMRATAAFLAEVAHGSTPMGKLFGRETDAVASALLAQAGTACGEDVLWCLTTAYAGLGYAGIEPKAFPSMFACYATSSRGRGDHTYAWTVQAEEAGLTGAGNIAAVVANSQWGKAVVDSLGICDFFPGDFAGDVFLDLYYAVTGHSLSAEALIDRGKRIFSLEREVNGRQGRSRAYDAYIPPKFLTPLRCGPLQGRRTDPSYHNRILDAYYQLQGWTKDGEVQEAGARALA